MKTSIVSTGVFAAVFGITTLGVVAAQSPAPQADQQKPAAQADKEKPAGAKPHTMTGCLEKGADATMFRLTNVEEAGPKTVELQAARSPCGSQDRRHRNRRRSDDDEEGDGWEVRAQRASHAGCGGASHARQFGEDDF
jgi:hypothetical protein